MTDFSPSQKMFFDLYKAAHLEPARKTRAGAVSFLMHLDHMTRAWLYLSAFQAAQNGDWEFVAEYLERGYGIDNPSSDEFDLGKFLARVLRGEEKRKKMRPRLTTRTKMKHLKIAQALQAELPRHNRREAAYAAVGERLGMDKDNVAKIFSKMKKDFDFIDNIWDPLFNLADQIRLRASKPRATGEYKISEKALSQHFLP